MVKNILVYNFGPFRTPLDPFGMLTSLTCLAIFVCFIGAVFLGTPISIFQCLIVDTKGRLMFLEAVKHLPVEML